MGIRLAASECFLLLVICIDYFIYFPIKTDSYILLYSNAKSCEQVGRYFIDPHGSTTTCQRTALCNIPVQKDETEYDLDGLSALF